MISKVKSLHFILELVQSRVRMFRPLFAPPVARENQDVPQQAIVLPSDQEANLWADDCAISGDDKKRLVKFLTTSSVRDDEPEARSVKTL